MEGIKSDEVCISQPQNDKSFSGGVWSGFSMFAQGCANINDKIEPVHEISNNVVCATSKASDQPAHTPSLIRVFASRWSILWLLSYWLNTIWSF